VTATTETASQYQSARPPNTLGQQIVKVITTTDHKVIGKLYLITSFCWFLIGGVMAMLMRSELAFPGQQVVNDELYNQLFTMHGTIMLLLFATPLFFGFANVVMPLQIGAPDVAFPRLNMFSYWLFLFGGLIAASGFLTPHGAADFGWTGYAPLSDAVRSPGAGGDLWIMGLWVAGLGTILGAVNFITTIICMRAPGMTMFRMPIFTWNTLVTSLLVIIAFPILAGALLMLEADRQFGAHVFDAVNGGPILWQHLFWFFGHPEVYIIALPFFGIVTEVLPVFSRKPVFGYVGLVAATVTIAVLSVSVWAHHMFATGAVDLPFFSGMSFLIAVPTGVKFFNWIGTMWGDLCPSTPPWRPGERHRRGHAVAGRRCAAPGRRAPRADGVAGASRRGTALDQQFGPAPVRRLLHAGRAWLVVAGTIWLLAGATVEGATYDAVVHAVFLGFTISMIMAHAPSILPAVTRVPLPYRPAMYAPWLLLQLSLVLRLWGGDALGSEPLRRIGGAGNAIALLLFLAVAIGSAMRGVPAKPKAPPATKNSPSTGPAAKPTTQGVPS
jgi:hypothetical protein